jgi:hypothetical protein
MPKARAREIGMKAARIDVLVRDGETYHKLICPYCRRVLIFPVKSHLYSKGFTMRCSECKRVFKKFHREMSRD